MSRVNYKVDKKLSRSHLRARMLRFSVLLCLLYGCASKPAENQNLVVMEISVPAFATVQIKNIETNETKTVKLKKLGETRMVTYLPAGTYQLIRYKPYKNIDITTQNAEIKFVVHPGCSNLLGKLQLLGDYFHGDGEATKVFWEFEKSPKVHSWIANKMSGNTVCLKREDKMEQYGWTDFHQKYMQL